MKDDFLKLDDKTLPQIRKKILTYIEAEGMSPLQFAILVGTDPKTIYRIINGEAENITLKTILKIVNAMNFQ